RPGPGAVPFLVRRIVGDRLVDAGIVDQHVDLAVELGQGRLPDVARRRRIHEVGGDELVAALGRMADDAMPALLEKCISSSANPATGAGNEDVHGAAVSAAPLTSSLPRKRNSSFCTAGPPLSRG